MTDWLHQFNRKMIIERREVLLFLDNTSSYTRGKILKNIKLIFLPANKLPVCQPLVQGIG